MTTAQQSPVRREVLARAVMYVARITHEGVYMRQKGKRTEYGPVPWNRILFEGEKLAAQEILHRRKGKRLLREL